jgi:SNF2 family DNA or RNA helicase
MILQALQEGKKTFRLANGSLLILNPADFQEIFALLEALAGRKGLGEGKPVRLSRADMLYLARRLDEESNRLPEQLRNEVSARLAPFNAYEPPPAPAALAGSLRGYQLTGFHWLHKMAAHGFHALLADDMGLGKTVQAISVLLKFYEGAPGAGLPPSLIVCPATLVYNWMAELAKFAPDLPAAALYGAKNAREARLADSRIRVFVTSYSLMQRDIEDFEKIPFLFAVLDEAHKIKNRATQTFKCCRLVRARHRVALTGTPVENRSDDLLSIFEFLEPGFLSLYRKKMEENGDGGTIRKRVAPFILRRLKSQVLDDLPAKTEQILACELEDRQKKIYLALREQASIQADSLIREKGISQSSIHILALLTRLKQVCCHPALLDRDQGKGIPSAKLDLLLELVEEVRDGGHRALIFSQFTSMLAIIRSHFEQSGISFLYLDGETKSRLELTQKFNADPSISCFLISLKTGGHGLNLTGADTVIHYDQWWNPAVEEQATDRAHRIGQTKSVTVYKLVCRQTIEDKILELQKRKKALFADLIDGHASTLSLTAEEITEMLSD